MDFIKFATDGYSVRKTKKDFEDSELEENSVIRKFRTTAANDNKHTELLNN